MYSTSFIDDLASSAPTPGGGGASAYAGAIASALASMVGNLTVGKKKYAEVEEDVQAALVRLAQIRERLLSLVDEDARTFAPLARAYGLPKGTPEEAAAKDAALQSALVGACEAPLGIMRQCVAVAEGCRFLAHNGSRLAVSDAGAAAALACAAAHTASLNVLINTASMSSKEQANAYRRNVDDLLAQVDTCANGVYDYVVREIG